MSSDVKENKSILKTVYLPPVWRRKEYGTYGPNEFPLELVSDSVLFLNIKNNETNETEIKMIERPCIDFYSTKEGYNCTYPKMAIEEKYVEKHKVEYSKREYEIAKFIGKGQEYSSVKRNGGYDLKKWVTQNIYNNPNIYHADINIEDYYRTIFTEKYGNNIPNLKRSFADIETFIYKDRSAKQDNPTVPINIITFYDDSTSTMFAFVLSIEGVEENQDVRNNPEKYIREYIEPMYDETYEELYSHFEKTKGKQGYVRPNKRPDIKTEIRFYDSEELLIIDFFNVLNNHKPDVCGWWNMNYDIKYIIGRCEILGIDYNDLFCNEEIPKEYRKVSFNEDSDRYKKDSNSKKPFQQMWDYVINPGYTEYIDQMSLYANFRKRYTEKNYKLDTIAEKLLGTKKVNLHDYGCTIANAVILKFKIFLKYSMKDTFLLKLIDDETNDLRTLFFMTDNTRVEQYVKISIVIKNIMYKYLRENNLIIGNNVVYEEWGHVKGAIVADPRLIDVMPNCKGLVTSMVFSHVVDFDASSEYPNIMIVFNIGKDASFGRILSIVDNNTGRILMSGEDFCHAIQASETSITEIGSKVFGLPKIIDIMELFETFCESGGNKNA